MNWHRIIRAAPGLAAASAVLFGAAAAEIQVGFNAGWNHSVSSDVSISGADGADFTIADTPWLGLSFPGDGGAPYYGARLAYWFSDGAGFGVMADYTHAKVRADEDAIVTLSGDTGSSGVAPGEYAVGELFDRLEFTNGVNFITLNAMYRFRSFGRFTPYLGAGAGVSQPHVEVKGRALSNLPSTYGFKLGGFTGQALAGVDMHVTGPLSVYGEYRLNVTPVDAPLSDPEFEIETTLITNQVLFGASLHF